MKIDLKFVIAGLVILAIILFFLWPKQKNTDIKTDKALASKDRVEMKQLAKVDTSLTHKIKVLRDSVKFHRERADYWMHRYTMPIKVTKQQVSDVFKNDSTTITKEVVKGIECDSLQKNQALTITSLLHENLELDSLVKIKGRTIQYGLKLDSLNGNIIKNLEKKVRNRTLGEVGLAILLVLAIIFHI